jgi:asparagine synthetase B (glutamine-hydrolysing)
VLLLYNGELYDVPRTTTDGDPDDASDTLHLYNTLSPLGIGTPDDELKALKAMDALSGPFAFILWSPGAKRLYFARDAIGRRSLLLASIEGVGTVLTSVVPPGHRCSFMEVPPLGLCYIDFREGSPSFGYISRPTHMIHPRVLSPTTRLQTQTHYNNQVDSRNAVELTTSYLPSTMLRTAMSVASDSESPFAVSDRHRIPRKRTPAPVKAEAVTAFLAGFELSVRRRLAYVPPSPSPSNGPSRTEAQVRPYAVLFSGGLDSLFLAAVLDRVLPDGQTLDLINVAFGRDTAAVDACPDRITAIQGYHELNSLSGGRREFRLLCANISPADADQALESHVRHLLHPADKPMDASVGTALWLAARGQGLVYDPNEEVCEGTCDKSNNLAASLSCSSMQISPARILFSGLGADELLGGYKGRHRTCFRLGGVEAVEREIDADMSRLWYRNLGRDDRIVSDHGRELRHPFLDEDLIRLVTGLPLVECVCDLSLPDGVGDKFLLRSAAERIGLPPAAVGRPKRAMQFGSRSKHVLERKQRA